MTEKEKQEDTKEEQKEEQKDPPLFRKEALEHKKGSFLGKTLIISPISFYVWTFVFFFVAVTIGLFLYYGSYSKHYQVTGILIPNKGLIHVYPKNPGIITKKYVKQGDKVSKGQLLYLISTEQHTLSEQSAHAQQIELLEKQIEVQKNRFDIAKKNLSKFKKLLKDRVIPETEYQKQHDLYLSLESSVNEIEQKLHQAKSSGDYAIRAPDDGIISSLIGMIGDQTTQKPLALIIPTGTILQAMLFVPTNVIGFIKTNQKVLLKYAAYPYRSFGLYEGTIDSIDKSVLFPKDVDVPGQNPSTNIPFYRVMVNLEQQNVNAYGKSYPLTSGITLDADILGNKRQLWQWIFDPIYMLKGSLKTS